MLPPSLNEGDWRQFIFDLSAYCAAAGAADC